MNPKDADDKVKQGFILLRAGQDQSLHPALRHVIEAQTEFGSWVPSSLCFYYVDGVTVGGRRIAEKNRRKPQLLGMWSIGTVEQGSGGRRDLVVDLYTSSERLRSVAATNLVAVQEVDAGFRASTDTSSHHYTQKIKKLRLVWIGRPAADSTRMEPVVESLQIPGLRGAPWAARLELSPAWRRSLVGSLRAEGKGDLAEALKSSPIRFVGPLYQGGKGQLRLTR
ncbi:MAG: hypothetical protein ACJ8BF_08455 [Gemmatimonadales bacterium]